MILYQIPEPLFIQIFIINKLDMGNSNIDAKIVGVTSKDNDCDFQVMVALDNSGEIVSLGTFSSKMMGSVA